MKLLTKSGGLCPKRPFNGRRVRKIWAFSKGVAAYKATAAWEDCYCHLGRPHKSLHLPVTDALPRKWLRRAAAVAAKLTDHIWTVEELLTTLPVPGTNNHQKVDFLK